MHTLITMPCPGLESSDFLRLGNITYAPELSGAADKDLLAALTAHRATALLTPRRPSRSLLRRWSGAVPGARFVGYTIGLPDRSGDPGLVEFRLEDGGLGDVAAALRSFERRAAFDRLAPPGRPPDGGRDVVLVGAGIVNLVTALHLDAHGYRVTVLDRSPAPGGGWRDYGCTHSGDDARMFTLTEMDNYNNQDYHGTAPGYFRSPVSQRGWLAHGRQLTDDERHWISEFERVPSWLARAYNDDIFAFAAESLDGWSELRDTHPDLFDGVALAEGVLRVYSDPAHLAASLARHRRVGALDRDLTPAELARDFPALHRPLRDGDLAGGFMARGFTLNVHKFTRKVIAHLEARGVAFQWDTPVSGVRRDAAGTVLELDTAGRVPRDAHVVASPGVHGRALLDGSPCAGRIHGILGGWIRISNKDANLGNSLKIARRGHVTEDANVTVAVDADGQEVLIVGSGYGYLGEDVDAVDDAQLAAIRAGILDTIDRLFPDRAEMQESSLPADNYDFKFCVRPWTATSLGLYHAETTGRGRLFIVNGGHNTGGFAQSPAIARAVLASLRGEEHAMHALYHPERFSSFAGGQR
ncbi:NAD(P)/FAD-dependent oxidoreductase [Longispora urticae]